MPPSWKSAIMNCSDAGLLLSASFEFAISKLLWTAVSFSGGGFLLVLLLFFPCLSFAIWRRSIAKRRVWERRLLYTMQSGKNTTMYFKCHFPLFSSAEVPGFCLLEVLWKEYRARAIQFNQREGTILAQAVTAK